MHRNVKKKKQCTRRTQNLGVIGDNPHSVIVDNSIATRRPRDFPAHATSRRNRLATAIMGQGASHDTPQLTLGKYTHSTTSQSYPPLRSCRLNTSTNTPQSNSPKPSPNASRQKASPRSNSTASTPSSAPSPTPNPAYNTGAKAHYVVSSNCPMR